jgi:hypothetical protein
MKRSNSQKLIDKNKATQSSQVAKLAKDLGFSQNNKSNVSTRNNSMQKNKYIETNSSYRKQTFNSKDDRNNSLSVRNNPRMANNPNVAIVANLKMKNVNLVDFNTGNTGNTRSGIGSLKGTAQSNYRSNSLNQRGPSNNIKNPPILNKPKIMEKNLINNVHNLIKPKIMKENQPMKNLKVFDQSKINSESNKLAQNSKMINDPKLSNQKRAEKPSDKISKIKTSDPFAGAKKHKTNFGYVYSAGGIPCRILHGSVKLKLKWDIEPESKT